MGRDIAVYLLAVCGAALEGNAFATKKWPVLQGVCEEFGEETPFTLEHKNICLGFLRFLINIFRDPEVQASRLTSKNRRDVEIVGLITLSKELEGQSMGVEGGGEFYPTSDVLRAMWVKVLKNRGDNDAWWKSRQPAGTKVNLVAS